MAKKLRTKATLEEAFSIGKVQGHTEALFEIEEMIEKGASFETLKVYLKAKRNTLNLQLVNNPFKVNR